MARISLDPPQTLGYRLGSRLSRRRYGVMLDPGAALGHNMQVGRSYAIFELQVERWRQLDRGLKDLAVMAVSAAIGCAWCMDFGYWETTTKHKVPAEKIRAVPNWRDSDVFTELERLVLEYAEAMTRTPAEVSDQLFGALRERFDEPQIVELTLCIGLENLFGRTSRALGVESEGFSEGMYCVRPEHRSATLVGDATER
jgi:AhpD family alkylhydroperoxidase